jgi:hypothetical protein
LRVRIIEPAVGRDFWLLGFDAGSPAKTTRLGAAEE